MNFWFLNESTIDEIIQNYSISKSGYYQLLVKWVEESRSKLESLIDLYSSDLDVKTFYSEKGLKERKQRIKFQCLASKNKENMSESVPVLEKKNKGIFENMTDFDKCLQILIVHNSKVQKILDKVAQAYQDRQNGVVRPPSPVSTKPKAKKVVKKGKKGAAVDITIKFKTEDGHVEEIVVKDKPKKKKGKLKKKSVGTNKSKGSSFKTSTDDENQTVPELDPQPEKTIEDLSKIWQLSINRYGMFDVSTIGEELGIDAQIENLAEIPNPGFQDIEEKYMQLLESSYKKERNVKDLKKVKIKASIRIIQRAWRRYYKISKLRKIVTIQLWYRNILAKRIENQKLGEVLKDKYFARVIQHRLKDLYKLKRSRRMSDSVKSRISSNCYDGFVRHIIKLQGFVKIIISKQKLRKKIYFRDQHFRFMFKKLRQLCIATRSIDSELVRRISKYLCFSIHQN